MKIIDNQNGIASGKIYNIGNPNNNYLGQGAGADDAGPGADISGIPRQRRRRCDLIETTAAAYYGKGYQDVQNRVPEDHQHLRRTRMEADASTWRLR